MLEEKILNDYREAMKARDNIKSTMLSTIRADMMNLALAKKKDKCDDNDIISIFRKHVKQHDDSIDQFTKGNRMDLVEKEEKELEILKAYLPAELAPEAINKVVDEVITATGAVGIRDMGKVIKEVNAQLAGKADGKTVSELVRERLSKAV